MPNKDPAEQKMIAEYLQNCRKKIDLVQKKLKQNDFKEIETLGHKLKGSGSLYDFPEITDLGFQIEKAAQEKNTALIEQACKDLQAFLESRLLF